METTIHGIKIEKMDTGRIQMSIPARNFGEERIYFEFKHGSPSSFDLACEYLNVSVETKILISDWLKNI